MTTLPRNISYIVPITLAAFVVLGCLWPRQAAGAEHPSFKTDIYPIIEKRCLSCHRPGKDGYEESGLDLRSYASLMRGTNFGPVIVPGDAYTSNLSVLIEGRGSKKIKMPHNEDDLSRWEKTLIRRWINRGAKEN